MELRLVVELEEEAEDLAPDHMRDVDPIPAVGLGADLVLMVLEPEVTFPDVVPDHTLDPLPVLGPGTDVR